MARMSLFRKASSRLGPGRSRTRQSSGLLEVWRLQLPKILRCFIPPVSPASSSVLPAPPGRVSRSHSHGVPGVVLPDALLQPLLSRLQKTAHRCVARLRFGRRSVASRCAPSGPAAAARRGAARPARTGTRSASQLQFHAGPGRIRNPPASASPARPRGQSPAFFRSSRTSVSSPSDRATSFCLRRTSFLRSSWRGLARNSSRTLKPLDLLRQRGTSRAHRGAERRRLVVGRVASSTFGANAGSGSAPLP